MDLEQLSMEKLRVNPFELGEELFSHVSLFLNPISRLKFSLKLPCGGDTGL